MCLDALPHPQIHTQHHFCNFLSIVFMGKYGEEACKHKSPERRESSVRRGQGGGREESPKLLKVFSGAKYFLNKI